MQDKYYTKRTIKISIEISIDVGANNKSKFLTAKSGKSQRSIIGIWIEVEFMIKICNKC